jgi:hypothetical protein
MREPDERERDAALPAELESAVRLLRGDPQVSDLWRQRLLHQIDGSRDARAPQRRWSLRPWVAVAACIGCLVVGAAGASLIVRPGAGGTTGLAQPSTTTVRFSFTAPAASQVFVVGDFNEWNPHALPMHRVANGAVWVVDVPLRAGRYAYSFVVDGSLARDPQAPQAGDDDFGSANSILLVRGS